MTLAMPSTTRGSESTSSLPSATSVFTILRAMNSISSDVRRMNAKYIIASSRAGCVSSAPPMPAARRPPSVDRGRAGRPARRARPPATSSAGWPGASACCWPSRPRATSPSRETAVETPLETHARAAPRRARGGGARAARRPRHARRVPGAGAPGPGRLLRPGAQRGDRGGAAVLREGAGATWPAPSCSCSTRCWPPAARRPWPWTACAGLGGAAASRLLSIVAAPEGVAHLGGRCPTREILHRRRSTAS